MKDWYMFPTDVNSKSVNDAIIYLFRQFYNNEQVEITFYISSIGGDIDAAIRFYDFVKSTGIKLNTIGFGQVDSAAIVLFLAGKERILIKNCRVRLHPPTYSGSPPSVISVHTETTAFLQQIDDRYFEIISSELSKSKVEVKKLFNKGKVLKPNEAVVLKIATKIEEKLPVFK